MPRSVSYAVTFKLLLSWSPSLSTGELVDVLLVCVVGVAGAFGAVVRAAWLLIWYELRVEDMLDMFITDSY